YDPTKANTVTRTSAAQWTANVCRDPVMSPTSRANTPVINMPTIPPTPWQGNTSSVSSSADRGFQCTTMLDTVLARTPMNMLSPTFKYSATGVMDANAI